MPDPTERWTPETAYLNIHGTGRPDTVATTIAVSPTVNVDLLADGRIAGIETIGAPIDATVLLTVLHHASLLTPQAAAVLAAARTLTAEDLDLAAITDDWVALYDALAAAVDAEDTLRATTLEEMR